jgi:ribonuclease BN (tRNA processing enzyme)
MSVSGVLLLTGVKSLVSSVTLNNKAGPAASGHDPDSRPESGHVPTDRMVILGSGGARIVVARQLRASGGIWFSLDGTRLVVDPGPGALVRMTGSRHRLDPTKLAGILLSHRHLDHSGDVNNMIEAMTMGGTEPRGALFAPSDVLEGEDPVVLKYVRPFLERIVKLEEGGSYQLGKVRFTCPVRHQHRGEVYGFKFRIERSQKPEAGMQKAEVGTKDLATKTPGHQDEGGRMKAEGKVETPILDPSILGSLDFCLAVSYIADTRYFPDLAEHYRADVVIMNVVRPSPSALDHLCAPDAEELVKAIRPKLAVLTHFGMKMLQARPWVIAREMSERTGCKVVAASDGMLVDFEQFKATSRQPQAASIETRTPNLEFGV